MADLSILAGATSQSILVDLYILATGAPQTGLVFNSSGLTANYSFAGVSATSTSITLATLAAVTSAYSSGGFKELDATNMPGVYRFDVPAAVLAASKGREVIITFNGFSGMATRHIKIELTAVDNQSTGFGLVNVSSNVVQFLGTASAGVAGYAGIDWSHVNAPTTSVGLTGTTIATSQAISSVSGSVGSVTGSVGSVTGSVASVTGNIGGTLANLSTAAKADVSTAVLTTAMTEAYPTKNSTFTLAQGMYNLVQRLNEMGISTTTLTVTKRDQSTVAKTFTLDSATAPTRVTEAT